MQRIFSKLHCEVADANAKLILINQIEKTSVLILTANSPQTLKTMLMLQRPNTIDDAYTHVLNYNMIESQVNFTNMSNVNNNQFTNNNNNHNFYTKQSPVRFLSNQAPMTFPQQQFPSQPIQIRPRPVQRHYPTNTQVFRKSRNVFPPQNHNKPKLDPPTPMSTSTAGPSRQYQQRIPFRPPNFFQSSGPKNFVSQELTNIETNTNSYPDVPYIEDNQTEYYSDYSPQYHSEHCELNPQYDETSLDPILTNTHDQNDYPNFEQNFENDNFANFPKPGPNLPLT